MGCASLTALKQLTILSCPSAAGPAGPARRLLQADAATDYSAAPGAPVAAPGTQPTLAGSPAAEAARTANTVYTAEAERAQGAGYGVAAGLAGPGAPAGQQPAAEPFGQGDLHMRPGEGTVQGMPAPAANFANAELPRVLYGEADDNAKRLPLQAPKPLARPTAQATLAAPLLRMCWPPCWQATPATLPTPVPPRVGEQQTVHAGAVEGHHALGQAAEGPEQRTCWNVCTVGWHEACLHAFAHAACSCSSLQLSPRHACR